MKRQILTGHKQADRCPGCCILYGNVEWNKRIEAEKIRPVFELGLGKPMPMYGLSDLMEYFA